MAKRDNEEQIASKHWQIYTNALSVGHLDFQRRARINENFYLGGGRQWEDEDRQVLELMGRPCLEENMIFSTVNTILGLQTQSRMDVSYKPRESGDQDISDILTKLSMFVLDQNKFPWVESEVFSDGMIQQRGYFDIRMDFTKNIFGEISVNSLDPLSVIPDQGASSYDPDDWGEVLITHWVPLERLKESLPPKKFREILGKVDAMKDSGPMESMSLVNGPEMMGAGTEVPRNTFSNSDFHRSVFRNSAGVVYILLLERQYWKTQNRTFFVDTVGDLDPAPDDMSPAQVKRFARENNLDTITRPSQRVRWSLTSENALIFDEWSPYDHFTVVPYFPYFRRGVTLGIVDNLIDTQEMLNKVFSQILHSVNTTANSGWSVEENSLSNMDTDDLEANGGKTGLIIEYRKNSNKPEKIQPNSVPTGLKDVMNTGVELMRLISGVSESFQGGKSNEVSGVAIQTKVQQTATQLATPIDNLFRTRNLIGERLLKLIQQFYTDFRVFNIVTDNTGQATEEVIVNGENELGELINDVTVGKYDVVIADVPTAINFQNAQFAQAVEMRKFGVNIPDSEMVRLSTLSRKDQIIEQMGGSQSPEQERQLKLGNDQIEADIERDSADAQKKKADALAKLTDVATQMKDNPGLGILLDQLREKLEEGPDVEVQQ